MILGLVYIICLIVVLYMVFKEIQLLRDFSMYITLADLIVLICAIIFAPVVVGWGLLSLIIEKTEDIIIYKGPNKSNDIIE